MRKVKVSLAELCGPRPGSEHAERGPDPAPPTRAPPANAAAPSVSKWPLFVGIGGAGVVLIGAGAFAGGLFGTKTAEPAPAIEQADAKKVGGNAPVSGEARPETPSSRFELLATVADPDGYSNVRDAPSIKGRIVGRVQEGKAFATYRQLGRWWQVHLPDGTTGYIARSRIRLSGETDASADRSDRGYGAPAPNPSDMTFPDSSTRLLAPSEVAQLGSWALRIARNEIYARKGAAIQGCAAARPFRPILMVPAAPGRGVAQPDRATKRSHDPGCRSELPMTVSGGGPVCRFSRRERPRSPRRVRPRQQRRQSAGRRQPSSACH